MYPLLAIVAYARWRKDNAIAYLTGGLGLVGMFLSGYHYVIQHQNSLNLFSCGMDNPCTLKGWHISFVTIPFLAFVAFTVITIVSGILIWRYNKKRNS